jgi:2-succinyl-5-enolpyruvyl-6-hydroxy-3-cyclohexene-1-carboxylate synthase
MAAPDSREAVRSAAEASDPAEMPAPNRTALFPVLCTDELVRGGVQHACVTPGSRSGPLVVALASHPALRVWPHLDERSAAFFALGLAKATRLPVALACTSGTAAANFLPAVVEAFHARVPLVVLTADRPPELRDCGAPQTIDQVRLFGSHVRWFVEVGTPEATPETMRWTRTLACRAVATACGPPAGPVHLNLALREPLAPEVRPADFPRSLAHELAASGRPRAPWVRLHGGPPDLDAPAVAEVAAMLRDARRPLIVCGPLDDPDPTLAGAVAALAQALRAPVLAEPASNLRRRALADRLVDAHDAVLRVASFRDAHVPDAVLRLGAHPTSKALSTWLARHPEVPQVGLDGELAWTDPAGVVSAVLRGTPARTATALVSALRCPRPDERWLDAWRHAGAAAREALRAALSAEAAPFEGHAVEALAVALAPETTLYAGSSLAIRDLDWFWPAAAPPVRVLANRGANGIDGFVSSVLGAAAGLPGPTVGLCGDLTFLHDIGGLLAARRHGLRAVFVVLDNDGGGIFEHLPIASFPEHLDELFVTPHGLDLGPLVEACGARFTRVTESRLLASAVREALRADRTAVLAVPIDRGHSLAAHRRAWNRAAAVLEAST